MPLANRVTPFSAIEQNPARGTLMGNRGILHGSQQNLLSQTWKHPHWVICELKHKDWHRNVMTPNQYTELFFLDEATALAAGHRPCAMCRRADFNEFLSLWAKATGEAPRAPILDQHLHPQRVRIITKNQRDSASEIGLPDGAMFVREGKSYLRCGDKSFEWTHSGYLAGIEGSHGEVEVLTPPLTLQVLRDGYRARIHPSAFSQ